MNEITAVVLAAGMGVRMGARGRLMPKGLIPLGGRPIVAQSVATLRGHGVGRIVIVTGHLREQYEALFAGSDIELVYNPDYASTGSLRSLAVGLEQVNGPCILVESDLIYAPQALDTLDCSENRFLLSGPTGAGDEVYVWTESSRDGRNLMVEISKDAGARAGAHQGEMVGLTALTAPTVDRMREVAAQVLHGKPDEHYEPGLLALSRDIPIECPLIPDLPWAEIDDEAMLARAARLVYPRVLAARGS
ncbi:MAG: phosphocholine cytidylyltransferase family protein [Rhodobacter sp.]|nr:phosphocholine cytidylyltransferase family protein [Rhodobacter sp.]